jgi:hypothetical protein
LYSSSQPGFKNILKASLLMILSFKVNNDVYYKSPALLGEEDGVRYLF